MGVSERDLVPVLTDILKPDSVVDILTRLRGNEFLFRLEQKGFSLPQRDQTNLGPTQPPLQRVLGVPSGVKQEGNEADHSP